MRFSTLCICTILAFSLAAQDVQFSMPAGFYPDGMPLLALSTGSSLAIRYTLDGQAPSHTSALYQGPILLEDRSPLPNHLANIPTNPPDIAPSIAWKAPAGPVPKSTLVQAALFDQNGGQVGNTFSEEYFIGQEISQIKLPVLSIWSDSTGLFGYEEGIYVPGKDYDENPSIWQPGNYFNEGPEWERVAAIRYYEEQALQLHHNAELKIHGGGSRMMPCKSLRLSAKSSLGAPEFFFPFFKDRDRASFKRLILRNAGQDFTNTLLADVLMHGLVAGTGLEYQSSNQVVVFINGHYWGIHAMRERYDKYYLQDYHQAGLDDIDLVEISMAFVADEGSSSDYEALVESLPNLDLRQNDAFEQLSSKMDMGNFMDEHISKIYGGGRDWAGNNERAWRTHEPGSKWRWLAVDYDDAFVDIKKDAFGHATHDSGTEWPNPEWSTRLFRHLMTNEGFAKSYKRKLRQHLDTTFHPDRVTGMLDSLAAILAPEMPRHVLRWGYPASLEAWKAKLDTFKLFAQQRPEQVWQNFNDYFPGIYLQPEDITVSPNPAHGQLLVELPQHLPAAHYRLYCLRGACLAEGELTNEQQNVLPLPEVPAGMYLFCIQTDESLLVKKLLVH